LNGRPATLARATEEPNQETYDREEEDEERPKDDDNGRLPATTNLVEGGREGGRKGGRMRCCCRPFFHADKVRRKKGLQLL